ncbi:hypothetical protein [Pedobacter mucosus]|uniref:hypothetical protein n=1 Tax=Pedobacter mucosus TaxID=2895286 RepID=UPI001EE4B15C|nr:hypothetical protein [Pedobacter mucosus]UKT64410.1 hypothetical protein LOK61_01220 [Pedobacter mucosus]
MKLLCIFSFFCCLFFINVECYSQKGCLVGGASGNIYPNFDEEGIISGTQYYFNNGQIPTTAPSCPRAKLGTATGRTCKFSILGTSYPEYNYILLTSPSGCPIDDYTWLLILPVSLLSIYHLCDKNNASVS